MSWFMTETMSSLCTRRPCVCVCVLYVQALSAFGGDTAEFMSRASQRRALHRSQSLLVLWLTSSLYCHASTFLFNPSDRFSKRRLVTQQNKDLLCKNVLQMYCVTRRADRRLGFMLPLTLKQMDQFPPQRCRPHTQEQVLPTDLLSRCLCTCSFSSGG